MHTFPERGNQHLSQMRLMNENHQSFFIPSVIYYRRNYAPFIEIKGELKVIDSLHG